MNNDTKQNNKKKRGKCDIFIYLFITFGMKHWQDPILVNNKMKGCRDIKNNTIQKT